MTDKWNLVKIFGMYYMDTIEYKRNDVFFSILFFTSFFYFFYEKTFHSCLFVFKGLILFYNNFSGFEFLSSLRLYLHQPRFRVSCGFFWKTFLHRLLADLAAGNLLRIHTFTPSLLRNTSQLSWVTNWYYNRTLEDPKKNAKKNLI